jgi:hypothetical protein
MTAPIYKYQVVVKNADGVFHIDGPATRYTDAWLRLCYWKNAERKVAKLLKLNANTWYDDLHATLSTLNA